MLLFKYISLIQKSNFGIGFWQGDMTLHYDVTTPSFIKHLSNDALFTDFSLGSDFSSLVNVLKDTDITANMNVNNDQKVEPKSC